jgi:hypothetical protein
LGGDLGVSSLKSHCGLRIIWLDADPCIVVLVLYRFHYVFKTWTLHYVEFCCNPRTYCNNSLLFGLCVCDVLLYNYYFCNNTLWWSWWDRTSLFKGGMSHFLHIRNYSDPSSESLKGLIPTTDKDSTIIVQSICTTISVSVQRI